MIKSKRTDGTNDDNDGRVVEATASLHKQASIEFIRAAGALAVKVNPRDKNPAKGWSPKNNDKNLTESILREANKIEYDHNLGIHLFGNIVDVDIDSDAPALMDALERFLPPCSHIWGHSSRLRTHRVYQIKAEFDPQSLPILRMVKRIPEVKVEIRGGQKESGQYSVVPGSIHPSGEEYLWHDLKKARSTLAVVDLDRIVRAIRMAGAVSVLAPYWTEGNRNNLILPLSGFLHRTSKIVFALGEEEVPFKIDRDSAELFISVLMQVMGDDHHDYRARMLTFQQTWDKAEKDRPVTGGNTLTKLTGDDQLLPKLYTLLCDSPDITTLDEFTERFAIWTMQGIVIDMDAAAKGVYRPFMTRQQFCNSYGHRYVETAGKRKLVADMLFHMPTTMRLDGLTFEPGKELLVESREGVKVNQWAGFAIEPHAEPVSKEQIAPFLEYLFTVIASSNTEHFEWVLGWIAHIFQEPADKAGTALVLVGLPGIGKSFLGQYFLVPMIGSHAVTTSSADRAVAGFNALFDNKVFVQCDEAISNRERKTAGRLKSLITDPTILIEPKGIDAFEKPNHMRLLFTSNETRDAVFLSDGMDDRRYTVLEVSNVWKGEREKRWHPLASWSRNAENLARIHRYLLDYKYSRTFISTPLRTEAKIIMQEYSMPVFDRWLANWLARGHPLSEQFHRRWCDAPVGNAKEVIRNAWPVRINYAALAEDLNFLIKQDRGQHALLNAQQIKHEFIRRKFMVEGMRPMRIVDRVFDNRDQKFVTIRTMLHGTPSEKEIQRYLNEKYGAVELSGHEEPEDFKATDKEEEF